MAAAHLKSNRTLIDNWVEERQCSHLEEGNRNEDGTLSVKLHRTGHKGILTTSQDASIENSTTIKDSFLPPPPPSVRTTGKRQEILRKQLYDLVSAQTHEEFHPPPPPMDYTSTTKKDFTKEFTPTKIPPTKTHDVNAEQPVTYWTENMDKITGVSQVATSESPFKKNTAFSTPIEEYLDQPKPHSNTQQTDTSLLA